MSGCSRYIYRLIQPSGVPRVDHQAPGRHDRKNQDGRGEESHGSTNDTISVLKKRNWKSVRRLLILSMLLDGVVASANPVFSVVVGRVGKVDIIGEEQLHLHGEVLL